MVSAVLVQGLLAQREYARNTCSFTRGVGGDVLLSQRYSAVECGRFVTVPLPFSDALVGVLCSEAILFAGRHPRNTFRAEGTASCTEKFVQNRLHHGATVF